MLSLGKYRLVLFDFDGTLLYSTPALIQAANKLLQQYSLPPREYKEMRNSVYLGAKKIVEQAFRSYELPADIEILYTEFLYLYKQDILYESGLYPGIASLLKQIEEKYVPWGIVTNKPRYLTEIILDKLDLTRHCQVLVCGDDAIAPKPSAEGILLACETMDILAAQSVYIGDSEIDIAAGNAAKMDTIAVKYDDVVQEKYIQTWEASFHANSVDDLIKFLF